MDWNKTNQIGRFWTLNLFVFLFLVGGFKSFNKSEFYSAAYAAETLSYPELQVVPKASERLHIESLQENSTRWSQYIPIQTSALMTIIAGAVAKQNLDDTKMNPDDFLWAQRTNYIIGGAWLGITIALSSSYRPYNKGMSEIKNMPNKTLQEQLVRERFAEENILESGQLGDILMYTSIVSNFMANAYLSSKADRMGQIASGIGIAFSIAPFIFKSNWQKVRNYHLDYKKRIFSPLVINGNQVQPGFQLTMTF